MQFLSSRGVALEDIPFGMPIWGPFGVHLGLILGESGVLFEAIWHELLNDFVRLFRECEEEDSQNKTTLWARRGTMGADVMDERNKTRYARRDNLGEIKKGYRARK